MPEQPPDLPPDEEPLESYFFFSLDHQRPEGFPYHPYDDPEIRDKFTPNKLIAQSFWRYLVRPQFRHEGTLMSPFEPLDPKELTPEKVVELFDQYKQYILTIRQDKQQRAMKLPRSVSLDLHDFTLYDVFVWGDWDSNRDDYYGIPVEKRTTQFSAMTARKEQVLALVEEAMDLADQRPNAPQACQSP